MQKRYPRGPRPHSFDLSGEVLKTIQAVLAKRKTELRISLRYKIILLLSKGERVTHVAEKLDVSRHTIINWRNRFLDGGLDNLLDKPRTGRPPVFSPSSAS